MKKACLTILAVLFAAAAMATAWPVSAAYDASSDDVNVANIQSEGYHNVMQAGKVYKFQFSDGTTAYFLRLPGMSSLKFRQVSEEEYEANPGAEHDSAPNGYTTDVRDQNESGPGGYSELPPDPLTIDGDAPIFIGGGNPSVTCEPACF